MSAYPRRRNADANSERLGKRIVEEHLADVAALAEQFPASVSFAHFIKRDLGAAIEAGRCAITMPHPAFASLPGVPVVDVTHTDDGIGYIVTTIDGSRWTRYCKGSLAVTWHVTVNGQPDGWDKLSSPMQHALRALAGDCQHKPRWNTLRALETRGYLTAGRINPSGQLLYNQHRGDFAHD